MPEQSRWVDITQANPDHSAWYLNRFVDMAAEGRDLHGEARLIDAMSARAASILDAGCGPGRVGGELARLGHKVVGFDVDPVLIAEAARQFPDSTWRVGDLAEMDLEGRFDTIVCAGNVMTFLAVSTRQEVLKRLGHHLADEGRLVIGFGMDRGYEVEDFWDDAKAAGLEVDLKLGTWDLKPFTKDSDFLVAVLIRP
jgi:SAM-dependent methyltransferase